MTGILMVRALLFEASRSTHSFPNLSTAVTNPATGINRSVSSCCALASLNGCSGTVPTGPQSRLARAAAAHAAAQQQQEQLKPVFDRLADEEACLPIDQVEKFLAELFVDCSGADLAALITAINGNKRSLDWTETLALHSIIVNTGGNTGSIAIPPLQSPGSPPHSPSSPHLKAPLKKVLTKNRYYMETGMLAYDVSVCTYIHKLEDHRRKCEEDGRYSEARATVKRLADLKTAQVEQLRKQLVSNQRHELDEVHRVWGDESGDFQGIWQQRCTDYEASFMQTLEELQALHQQQLVAHADELQARRPMRHKPSKSYLEQRAVQDRLVQAKDYRRAEKVKAAADELYGAELLESSANYDVEVKLKVVKFQVKQAQDMEVLLQRGQRGRDELELRRVSDTERRTYRFRNIVAELESLHRLELVHLENFLEGQVQAGKAVPLKDGFKRKREMLLSTRF